MLLVLALLCASSLSAQLLHAPLDGDPTVRSAIGNFEAALLLGAEFVPSAEGKGVRPGLSGPALTIPVPAGFWQLRGTLEFRFALDRKLRFGGAALAIPLMDAPLLRATLRSRHAHPVIEIGALTASGSRVTATVNLTRLEADTWYHLALAWDAEEGLLAAFLNGVPQGELRPNASREPWSPARRMDGVWHLGGSAGKGADTIRVSIDEPRLHDDVLDSAAIEGALDGRNVAALDGEGRMPPAGSLDLADYKLVTLFETDFAQPLEIIDEGDLFEGRSRHAPPPTADWIFEGRGSAIVSDGRLIIEGLPHHPALDSVLWSAEVLPEEFLLEVEAEIDATVNSSLGLFIATTTRAGADIFEGRLVRRSGAIESYTLGALNNYWVEYAATRGRATTEIYRNAGRHLVAIGFDASPSDATYRLRLLKAGGRVQVEVNSRLVVDYAEQDELFGAHLAPGRVGLRQHSEAPVSYTGFRVSRLDRLDAVD